jgi:periplasmic copper chaperone A
VASVLSAVTLAAVAVAGCAGRAKSGPASIAATAAYIQLPTGTTTVGYLDIRNNGTAGDQLTGVSTSVGGTVQLRAPAPGTAPVVMHTVASIDIPAGTLVKLVPNSYHLLITGAGPMHDGKDITLTLKFARAGLVTTLALVTNPASGGGGYFS